MSRLADRLGIRLVDVAAAAAVCLAVELNAVTGGGSGAHPQDALTYLLYGSFAIPVLLRHKWPLRVLIACAVLLLLLYTLARRNISPAPPLTLPVFDAVLAGYLVVGIAIPAAFMLIGLFVVEAGTHESLATLSIDFLLPSAVLAMAVLLGETVRSRRALAAETAAKLRLAAEERDAEAARAVAEERLRIARELHDTVAHSMATITVQAGTALHLLGDDGAAGQIRHALTAIRDTSKGALADIRITLGQLRGAGGAGPAGAGPAGLDRLDALSDAVRAAGAAVSVSVEGEPAPLPAPVDHAAYRILQESLTNVLRHAGPEASATVRLCYADGGLTLQVTDDGTGPAGGAGRPGHDGAGRDGARQDEAGQDRAGQDRAGQDRAGRDGKAQAGTGQDGSGHGLTGMAERAAAVGGRVSAGPRPDGGFEVTAWLPRAAAEAAR